MTSRSDELFILGTPVLSPFLRTYIWKPSSNYLFQNIHQGLTIKTRGSIRVRELNMLVICVLIPQQNRVSKLRSSSNFVELPHWSGDHVDRHSLAGISEADKAFLKKTVLNRFKGWFGQRTPHKRLCLASQTGLAKDVDESWVKQHWNPVGVTRYLPSPNTGKCNDIIYSFNKMRTY